MPQRGVLKKSAFLVLCVALVGCGEQQMARQPAYRPLQPSAFFPDGRSARPLVPGTVARGHLDEDSAFFTGKSGKSDEWTQAVGVLGAMAPNPLAAVGIALGSDPYEEEFPFPITPEVLERGQQRYNIFCAVCHDRVGTGKGMIVLRGFTEPPSLHESRLRHARVGYLFHVITKGFGSMPDYASQIPPADRWKIVAYVRSLQFSQHAPAQLAK
ncbi:MAG TPA: cytochrome c [Gemmataceae bacterium]|nr:cytochrome c [Gemmataceae bacterium]